MTGKIFFATLLLSACTGLGGSQKGELGQTGAQGERGPKGDTGPKGTDGASGVCDTASCPQSTSVDGLSGGTLSSALSAPSLNVSGTVVLDSGSAPAPRGIIVARGGKQTSINGFYCGKTSFDVNGHLGDPSQTQPPNGIQSSLRQAKDHCEHATGCNHPAAHPCLASEILQSVMLGGGSSTFTANEPNAAVPMPPSSPTANYWVLPSDGNAECFTWSGGATTLKGLVYKLIADEGAFVPETCDVGHPLLCCL